MRRCLDCNLLVKVGSRCPRCLKRRAVAKMTRRDGHARSTMPQQAKRRDGACVICGATQRLEAHHVTPVAAGGSHDLSNVVTLCHRCHVETHRRLAANKRG